MLTLHTANNLIIQRDSSGRAVLPISGSYTGSALHLSVSLIPVKAGWGTAVSTTTEVVSGKFEKKITAKTGWYRLLVTDDQRDSAEIRMGVGEVFLNTGHSIASNNGRGYPEDLPIGERVITLDMNQTQIDSYQEKLDSEKLPFRFIPVELSRNLPINSDPQHWGNMAYRISEQLNCPVLVLNAAYGGSSLEMWAKGVKGEEYDYFDGYADFKKGTKPREAGKLFNYEKPIPYGVTKALLEKVIAQTGIRAILAHHGENDRNTEAAKIEEYYKTTIEATRQVAKNVAWFICLASVSGRKADDTVLMHPNIRTAQENTVKNVPYCYPGADYDAGLNQTKPGVNEVLNLTQADRYDDLHLSIAGQRKAAGLWADAILSKINVVTPFVPVPPAAETIIPISTLVPKRKETYEPGFFEVVAGVSVFVILSLTFLFSRK